MTAAPEPSSERGSLAEGAFPRLLLELYRKRFTGRLRLSRARTQKTFVFQQGAAVGSESNLPNEWLSAVLQDLGKLSAGDRDRVNQRVQQKKCREGVALLALQLIEPKALFAGLREQLRRRAIECFGWVDGEFELEESDQHSEEIQPFRMDPYPLVHQGLQGHWGLERMFSGLEPRMQLYPRPAPEFAKVARRLTLDATVERMIANLGGQQKLGAVLGAAANSPRAIAAFWLFDAVGALKYSEAPAHAEADPDNSQPEIEISIASEAELRQTTEVEGAATAAASATSEESNATLTPAAEKMRTEVLDRLEKLDSLDYYELLGIKRNVDTVGLRKAYFSAAKRYHPDAIARLGLQTIRVEAGQVFARIAEANDTLSDDAKRRDYDILLSGDGKGVDVAILAQAETFYRKGEILLKMGNFRGALELLQSAVSLYPDECVYQSDLGWAYYKKNPPEVESALEHLQQALRLDPSDSVAGYRLGVIEEEAPPG